MKSFQYGWIWYRSSLDQIKYIDDSEKLYFLLNNELIYYDDLKLSRDIPKCFIKTVVGTSMGCNGPSHIS